MPHATALFAVEGDPDALHLCRQGLLAQQNRSQLPQQWVVRPADSVSLRRVAAGEEWSAPAAVGRAGSGNLRLVTYLEGPVAIALDAGITNGQRLRTELLERGLLLGEEGDSEWVLQAMAASDQKTFVNRLVDALGRLEGGFAMIALDGSRMVACRDPWGLRPLCLGRWKSGFLVASEGAAITAVGGEWLRELQPGEMLILEEGRLEAIRPLPRRPRRACMMEVLRLGRPESTLQEVEGYAARGRLGDLLARQHPALADVVLPMPGAEAAAIQFARRLGIPLEMSGNAAPFGVARSVVTGRSVVLVDLAMVRERPLQAAVRALRDAGAIRVHVRLAGPMVMERCLYGVSLEEEGHWRESRADGVREFLECDSLGWLEEVGEAIGQEGWCDACITRRYPIEPPKGPGQLRLF